MVRSLHRTVAVFVACTAALASKDVPVDGIMPSPGPFHSRSSSLREVGSGDEEDMSKFYPPTPVFPSRLIHWDKIIPLFMELNEYDMELRLLEFVDFPNRHIETRDGVAAAVWLLRQITDFVLYNPIHVTANVTVVPYDHMWPQPSIIVTIPGQTNTTIVVGAHIDTRLNPMKGGRPGFKAKYPRPPSRKIPTNPRQIRADDNASGTVALVEILRALLQDPGIAAGKQINTIEFHWYSAQKWDSAGSGEIFQDYMDGGRDIRAMLNLDMLGFVHPNDTDMANGIDTTPHIAIASANDYTGLSQFVITCTNAYSFLSARETNGTDSDHVSARYCLFPSTMLQESLDELNEVIRRRNDGLDRPDIINYEHVREIAKVALAFTYELAFYKFPPNGPPAVPPTS